MPLLLHDAANGVSSKAQTLAQPPFLHASPYTILPALFFSLGGLIYLFANHEVRAACPL
jgi:hypothetical protein